MSRGLLRIEKNSNRPRMKKLDLRKAKEFLSTGGKYFREAWEVAESDDIIKFFPKMEDEKNNPLGDLIDAEEAIKEKGSIFLKEIEAKKEVNDKMGPGSDSDEKETENSDKPDDEEYTFFDVYFDLPPLSLNDYIKVVASIKDGMKELVEHEVVKNINFSTHKAHSIPAAPVSVLPKKISNKLANLSGEKTDANRLKKIIQDLSEGVSVDFKYQPGKKFVLKLGKNGLNEDLITTYFIENKDRDDPEYTKKLIACLPKGKILLNTIVLPNLKP